MQCKEFLLPPEISVLHCGILPQTVIIKFSHNVLSAQLKKVDG